MKQRKDIDERTTTGAPRAPGSSARAEVAPRADEARTTADARSPSAPGLPTPTLPKGGGAVRSIGEKFTMAAATGTCSLAVPLALSPGRSGFGPALSLAYSSGGGNSAYGVGWSLDVPAITRKTDKKLPEYHDGRDSDVFILSGAEDLVRELELVSGSWIPKVVTRDGLRIERYRPRNEGLFARIERRTEVATGNVFWVTIDRNNVTSIYGRSVGARVADPADGSKVFSWLLEATYDDRGNVCVYDYKAEDLASVPNDVHERSRREGPGVGAQKYLKRIRYGNVTPVRGNDLSLAALTTNTWCFTVVFDYGEHHATSPTPSEVASWPCRQDPFSTYKARFEIRTYRLCRRVLMFHTFPTELGTDVLVRSTEFAYSEGPSLTYLTSVTHKGWLLDGGSYTTASMPPVEFEYQAPTLSSEVRELPADARKNLPPAIDGRAHRWVDLDGEGIAGLLSEERGAWRYRRNLGGGNLAAPRALAVRPSSANLAGSRQQLLSLEGDGRLDLVEFTEPAPGYFERSLDGDDWASFRPFKSIPNVDWNDPNLQFIDLNGDGFADILITHGTSLLWYPSRGKDGFAAPIRLPIARDEARAPAVVFADGEQSLHLADMSGDGLADIVRIRNGEVSYWPNLGFGRFGARVTMANAPRLDRREQFDPARIRLFDVDGSGTTDLLYLGADRITLYSNLAGNSWSAGTVVTTALTTHPLATISVVDLLGTGTGCLTWFTSLPSEGAPRLRYIDLLASKKPHLLVKQTNGMGLERLMTYAASTKFYLEDLLAGVPWATRLPFAVQVVEKVETRDHLAGTRFVSTYRYRHGYFDGHEREFRGFGLVEQWDAETVKSDAGSGTFPTGLFPVVDGEFVLPPVHTKTWFHTGAWKEQGELTAVFRDEYYDGDSLGVDLPDTAYSQTALGVAEEREAARALKGAILRQEVYADDGTSLAAHPYTVSERRYEVRRIQPRTSNAPHAVFLVHPREELTYHYERDNDDPRVLHALTLEVDDYGTALKSAAIAYSRRTPAGPASTEQGVMLVTVAEQSVVHKATETHWYRVGVPVTATSYQLHGLAAPGTTGAVLSHATVKAAIDGASTIAYEATPTSGHQKRVLSKQRTLYYKDDLTAALSLGSVESLALVHHVEQLALTGGLITSVYNTPTTTVDSTMLTTGCGYVPDLGDYWAPSARPEYDDDHFFLPVAVNDPFGNRSAVTYDGYFLLVAQADSSTTTSLLNNVVTLENDYRVLQPKQLTDPNDNRTALAFDALGMVVKTALMGKASASEGDTLANPTTTFEYDLWAFKTSGEPVVAHMQAREEHGGTAVWQHAYVYTDGSGRELLTKTQAAPDGATPRWVGSGRTHYDNKGNPIKKYEPYFSTTSDYESEASIVATGVTPILRYDPLGRLTRTDFPDGTHAKVVFDAWQQADWDQNDTVDGTPWYTERMALSAGDPKRRAAELAYEHRNTPTVTHFDTLGRATRVVQNAGGSPTPTLHTTTTTLDIQGNPLAVVDARGNTPLAQTFDLLKRPIRTVSAEAGTSRMLPDVAGVAVYAWNSRLFATRMKFDALRRPTHVYSKHDTDDEILVLRSIYGEELGATASKADNLRGQLFRNYDSAGAETFVERDFKGNLRSTKRVFVDDYTTTPDWMDLETPTDLGDIETAAAALLENPQEEFVSSWTYDALNRIKTSTSDDGSVQTPSYNEANQLVAVEANVRGASATDFIDDVTYNARSQRLAISYANGVVTECEYDAETFRLTRVESTRTSDSALLQDLRYYFDAVGNITETRDYANQSLFYSDSSAPALVSGDQKYEYDPLYRLVYAEGREHPAHALSQKKHEEIDPGSGIPHANDLQAVRRYTEEYSYDGVGNILELVHTAGSDSWTRWYQYAIASNKLTGTSDDADTEDVPYDDTTSYTDAYTHDAGGNMTSLPHITAMEWDFGDRLQHCDLVGGGDSYFLYDAAGQRVRKVWVNDTTTIVRKTTYAGDHELFRETISGTLEEKRETLHVMDDRRRVVMVETPIVEGGTEITNPTSYQRFQLGDHLGSSRVELDEDGDLLTYEEYHPYGTTAFRASSGAAGFAPKRYRYTGKERDEETGLDYYGARYYPPWLARWTACDSSGADGLNRYTYVRCNPVSLTDPNGRESCDPSVMTCSVPMSGAPSAPTLQSKATHGEGLSSNPVTSGYATGVSPADKKVMGPSASKKSVAAQASLGKPTEIAAAPTETEPTPREVSDYQLPTLGPGVFGRAYEEEVAGVADPSAPFADRAAHGVGALVLTVPWMAEEVGRGVANAPHHAFEGGKRLGRMYLAPTLKEKAIHGGYALLHEANAALPFLGLEQPSSRPPPVEVKIKFAPTMLDEAIARVKLLPPGERVAAMERELVQIQETAFGSWSFASKPTMGGATAWGGKTHTILIDAEGNIFKAPAGEFGHTVVPKANGGVDITVSDWSNIKPR